MIVRIGSSLDSMYAAQLPPKMRTNINVKTLKTIFRSGCGVYYIFSQLVKWIIGHQGRDPYWEQAETIWHIIAKLVGS